MKLVIQRVLSSSVKVYGQKVASISKGLTILFCAEKSDCKEQAEYLAKKTLNLRIFPNGHGKMDCSCIDIFGEILVVSQFTLAGNCGEGRRPSFERAALPEQAEDLYRHFIDQLSISKLKVVAGQFGADMLVDIQNEGPVTFILER